MDVQFIPTNKTFHPTEARVSVASLTDVRDQVRALETRERRRGGTLADIRQRLAGRLGCAPGTLENINKGRLKRMEGWLRDRVRSLLMREIEREIRALEHELECLRAMGGDAPRIEIQEIEACLSKARSLLLGKD